MTCVADRLLSRYESGDLSRRDLLLSLSALMAAPAAAQTRQPPIEVRSLNHVTMFVEDVPRAVDFYQGLFGLPVLSEQGGGSNLGVGSDNQFLGIFGGRGTVAGRGEPAAIDHFCLGVADFDPDRIVGLLSVRGVEARVRMRQGVSSTDAETPEIYFQDPNGIRVQLQDASYCGGGGPLGADCGSRSTPAPSK